MSLNYAPLSVKRRMQDDDTFLPPPLSAYGLALLNEGSEKRSLSSMQIEENPALRANLKNNLLVHFKEAPRESESQNKSLNFDISGTNISTNMSHNNLSGHNMSTNMSGNISGHSFSSNMHTEENEDLIDASNDPSAKLLHTHATTPGGSQATGSLSRLNSIGLTKRSRFSRRFARLGPPKRASDVPEDSLTPDRDDKPDLLKPQPKSELLNAFKTPPLLQNQNLNGRSSPRRLISNESTFFKSLEKLRSHSNENSRLSPPLISDAGKNHNIPQQKPSRFLVYVDKHPPRPSSRGPSHRPWSRPPLMSISPGKINAEPDADVFRKPKLPKLSVPTQPPPPPSKSSFATPPQPTPASFPHPNPPEPVHDHIRSSSGSGGIMENGKRKKIIFVNNAQYEKLELIGRGGTSKVYKVRSLSSKKTYAIKKVTFDQFDDACVKGFKGEIDLLAKLRNEPRVVQLHDYAINDGNIFLTMECGELDLAHVLQQRQAIGSALDLSFVRFHAMEVLRCVEAVHRAGIVHSDLKPANFLFVRGIMKIIDFGIANAVPDHTANIYRESQIGTPNYMAPEALVEVNHTLNLTKGAKANTWKVGKPSDIWSCGCIIYQMIYGRPPYASYAGQQRIMAIMNPQVKVHFPAHGLGEVPVPRSAIELMQMCLVRNPHERWTVLECLTSDFLRPKAVSNDFVKDVVKSAVNYGYHKRQQGDLSDEKLNKLVDSIIGQIESLNYA
ncbi:hypothetical protein C7M61_004968 [Candidozyma pseudohaemuli]|uniref:Protein kinase domain-containing protein n=1 Tax=Candidozyma pseudohaemuli TaxID=418784 RepID=A0A2P7YF78_9ASCO|nr:hypothetical protein C7M61_004968 [[Candida] pseudohaemulonii]PSK34608.1 hypothetical protein C7M61_004968 [[Candida] pseudohaemulonii]